MPPARPAILVESRVVRAGRQAEFARWAERQARALAEAPGHLDTLRLDQAGGLSHGIARFEDADALRAWRRSAPARALAEEAALSSVGLVQEAAGPDVRLDVPSEAAALKWKRFVVTWAAVFPILLVLNTMVRALLPGWPPLAYLAITSPLLTAILQWLVLPRLQRWARYWMLRDADGRLRRRAG